MHQNRSYATCSHGKVVWMATLAVVPDGVVTAPLQGFIIC